MKHGMISFSSALIVALFATPLAAWADANPDFDDDAKPILRMQPGLLQYVESRFDIKDTGTAKYPGDDDRRPRPPFIFIARPAGSQGPYTLRLLIQPGPINHILNVVDMTRANQGRPPGAPAQPSMANRPPTQGAQGQPPPQAPAPSAPAPTPQPSEPTADTPSGPIMDSGSQAPSSNQPSLAPPPDPAPATR
jgi:hypothetical protein